MLTTDKPSSGIQTIIKQSLQLSAFIKFNVP